MKSAKLVARILALLVLLAAYSASPIGEIRAGAVAYASELSHESSALGWVGWEFGVIRSQALAS